MNLETLMLIVADLVAAIILTFGLYWRRHYRRDLVVAFFGINVGVLAVSAVLAAAEVGAGVGLGLFGVLSIIRLRSDELAQHEIAYYFAMLALGLLGGLGVAPVALSLSFMGLVVLTIAIIDHPALLSGHQRQQIVIDRAIRDPHELRAYLAALLDARITAVSVTRLDLVNDSTAVDVRFRRAAGERGSREHSVDAVDEMPVLSGVGR